MGFLESLADRAVEAGIGVCNWLDSWGRTLESWGRSLADCWDTAARVAPKALLVSAALACMLTYATCEMTGRLVQAELELVAVGCLLPPVVSFIALHWLYRGSVAVADDVRAALRK